MQSNPKLIAPIPDFEPNLGARALRTQYLGFHSPEASIKTERRAPNIFENASPSSKHIEPDGLVSRDRMSRGLISLDLTVRKHAFWTLCPEGTRLTWSTILRAFQYLNRSRYSRWDDARTIMSTNLDLAKHSMSHIVRIACELWHEEYEVIPSHRWTAKLKHVATSGEEV
jgi:hypothetical protein